MAVQKDNPFKIIAKFKIRFTFFDSYDAQSLNELPTILHSYEV